MTSSLSRHTELAFWSVVPAVLTLSFILLHGSAKYISGLSFIMPLLHLPIIFYWGLHSPRMMPYWFIFLAGLFIDILQGGALGLSSLLYILFVIIIRSQVKHVYKEGFLIKWGFFIVLTMVLFGVQWLMQLIISSHAYPLSAPIVGWITTSGCYPLIHLLCNRVEDKAALRRWHLQHVK